MASTVLALPRTGMVCREGKVLPGLLNMRCKSGAELLRAMGAEPPCTPGHCMKPVLCMPCSRRTVSSVA